MAHINIPEIDVAQPNGKQNQIDSILVRKHFWASVNIAQTRGFPWGRHWKWSWPFDDDISSTFEENCPTEMHMTLFWTWQTDGPKSDWKI